MKAVVCRKYGSADVLQITDMVIPVPAANEVLVKIHATTVNRTDCAYIAARPFFARLVTGLFKPKRIIPGTEYAGEVADTGDNVTMFTAGDKVFGFTDLECGCHAQYMSIAADKGICRIPNHSDYKTAAASSEGFHYALNFINKIDLKKGDNVLINGASGAIGSAAVQLARYYGAKITAVCNTKNQDLVKSLGAERIINYEEEDFTRIKNKYHFIFDCVGKSTFFRCKHLLQPRGIYISSDLGPWGQNLFLPLITPLFRGKKTVFPFPLKISQSVELVRKLTEENKFRAVIDREYPFEQIKEAYTYVEEGQKTGNVVVVALH